MLSTFLNMLFIDLGCFAYWCFPCFLCRLHSRTTECPCMWCFPGGKYKKKVYPHKALFVFIGTTALRTKIRAGLRIRVCNIPLVIERIENIYFSRVQYVVMHVLCPFVHAVLLFKCLMNLTCKDFNLCLVYNKSLSDIGFSNFFHILSRSDQHTRTFKISNLSNRSQIRKAVLYYFLYKNYALLINDYILSSSNSNMIKTNPR